MTNPTIIVFENLMCWGGGGNRQSENLVLDPPSRVYSNEFGFLREKKILWKRPC